jgi:predicted pyridoxine 5'-phosphate oxidase superfamily flavin-nucleotide-binding protein
LFRIAQGPKLARMRHTPTDRPASDVAFSPAVKAAQTRLGSRAAYRRMEEGDGWETTVTPELEAFIRERNSFYLGTASADGQPYIQHRGGPKGFLRVLDPRTLAFVDFAGNRQYVSLGNLAENDRAFLFLMDYARRRRIKIWGRARAVEDDPELVARLMPAGTPARPERVIVFEIAAWDVNCPKHIPQKLDLDDLEPE